MSQSDTLIEHLKNELGEQLTSVRKEHHEVTIECETKCLIKVLYALRDSKPFLFEQLIDVCAVDYLYYGQYDWETDSATESGFSRGVAPRACQEFKNETPRFCVVYHLLSISNNQRLRVKVYVNEEQMQVPSAHEVWESANWFEREAYDLFGILFDGHPDLRRILTDYGFIGYPFRKDFPVSGQVEMRYDATLKKVIYEPVDIEPRILVPKVIREDNRYFDLQEGQHD